MYKLDFYFSTWFKRYSLSLYRFKNLFAIYYDTHGSSWLSCSLIFYCILYSPSIYSVDKEVTREQCIYKGRTVWNVVTYFNCNKLAYVKLRVVTEVILILCVCYNSQRSENTLCTFILSCHVDSGNQALVVRLGIKCPHPPEPSDCPWDKYPDELGSDICQVQTKRNKKIT